MYEHLFTTSENQVNIFTPNEMKVVTRYRAAIGKLYGDPWIKDVELRNFLMTEFDVSDSQAWRDIPKIKYLFGNVQLAAKEYHRMRANKLIEDAHDEINTAETKLDVLFAEAKIKAAIAYVKINQLDKEDKFQPQWDDIQIPEYDVTDDVSVIEGKTPIPDLEEKKRQLRIDLGIVSDAVILEESKTPYNGKSENILE